MRNKLVGLTLSAMLFALCFSVEAQQLGKVPRIGFLQRRVDAYSYQSRSAPPMLFPEDCEISVT